MGGQVLGGGVIVLVAVLLWLVYLLPSWHQRRQYDAAERNAVRLNQALRVLAETSDTPGEVRLELNARTALAQQKLARQVMAEREQVALEQARVELDLAREERAVAQERARAERAAAHERARAEQAAARSQPAARRARARRRTRLTAMVLGSAGLALAGFGVWQVLTGASAVSIWAGAAVAVCCVAVLQRMSRVAARAAAPAVVRVEREATVAEVQDVALETPRRQWAPRRLPQPLASSSGSRAAAVLDVVAAREALRHAALEEAQRARAEAQRPPSIDTARRARPAASSGSDAVSEFARMGVVDDAEIEAHVRQLLARRAVGA